jgi:20S proteasome subunit beta 1
MTGSTVVEVEVPRTLRSVFAPWYLLLKVNTDDTTFPFEIYQAVADIVHYHAQFYAAQHDSRPPVHTIASLFQSLCYENKDRLSAGIIVAGWDEEQGGQVYNIPLGGGIFRQPWSIGGESRLYDSFFGGVRLNLDATCDTGSGSTYVYGYCDATYQEGMSEDETVNFVRNSMSRIFSYKLRRI